MSYNEHWIAGEPAPLYECKTCGAVVLTPMLHSKWHRFTPEEAGPVTARDQGSIVAT